jgi:hypothetical protein
MSNPPSYRKQYPQGDPVGPSTHEIRRAEQARNKVKYQTPYGFKEQKFGRRIWHRYPKAFAILGTSVLLGIFWGPVLHSAFRAPTAEELFLAELQKERFKKAGIWDRPPSLFTGWDRVFKKD